MSVYLPLLLSPPAPLTQTPVITNGKRQTEKLQLSQKIQTSIITKGKTTNLQTSIIITERKKKKTELSQRKKKKNFNYNLEHLTTVVIGGLLPGSPLRPPTPLVLVDKNESKEGQETEISFLLLS